MYESCIKGIYGYPVYYSKIEDRYLVDINGKLYYVDDEIRKIIEEKYE